MSPHKEPEPRAIEVPADVGAMVARFEAKNDMNYTVVIRNTDPPTMEILSEDK